MSKPSPRFAPGTEPLESRCVPTALAVTLSASPNILRPILPSNQPHAVGVQHVLPVTLAGEIAGPVSGNLIVRYQVVDQYGQDEPIGTITHVMPVKGGRFFYFTRIGLSDHRDPHIPGGRQYQVIVTAETVNGSGTATASVTVPPVGFFAKAARLARSH